MYLMKNIKIQTFHNIIHQTENFHKKNKKKLIGIHLMSNIRDDGKVGTENNWLVIH